MKNLMIFASLLLVAASAAQAGSPSGDTSPVITSQAVDGFTPAYGISSFQIAPGSTLLRGIGSVDSGSLMIDHATNALKLTLVRSIHCLPGMYCVRLAPAPTVIVLPITRMDSDSCLGTDIIAGLDPRDNNGRIEQIEVKDTNGTHCANGETTFTQPVAVTVTEQDAPGAPESVSVLTGSPVLVAE